MRTFLLVSIATVALVCAFAFARDATPIKCRVDSVACREDPTLFCSVAAAIDSPLCGSNIYIVRAAPEEENPPEEDALIFTK